LAFSFRENNITAGPQTFVIEDGGDPVRNRTGVFAVALSVALLGACTSRPATQISSTASVSVNGIDTNFHVVKCGQFQWTRTIDIGGGFAGAKLIIDEGAHPASAQSVRIQNLGGFTGMYSRGGDNGDAEMSMTGDKFTVSGTANGHKTDVSGDPMSAPFKIVVTC
jgi:ipoprotein LpqH